MKEVICPYCGQRAEFVDSIAVYRRSYGMIYLCRPCDAYVGVHGNSDQPLGRLANAELRKYKVAAHDAFDPLWKTRRFLRSGAYAWLAKQMHIPIEKTHIGMFDVTQCKQVVALCNGKTKEGFVNG